MKKPLIALLLLSLAFPAVSAQEPLTSWNDGPAKQAVIKFVNNATTEGSPGFVAPEERIAAFDNDGTLWCEQPMYFQMLFALDRIRAMAKEHPEWNEKEPYRSILANNMKGLEAAGRQGLLEVVAATHSGMTVEEFQGIVKDWLKTARHPRYKRPYTECVYQPMLELLAYLRAKGFKTFIVSGGGVEFMRAFAEQAYGVPPEQVVGSCGITCFEVRDGKPVLVKQPKVLLIDDGPGKPVAINTFIGRRPVMCFGNSDGDLQMLQYTSAGDGPRFGLIVHHDDEAREYLYDRDSRFGKLAKALDEAPSQGWTVVSMKSDWKTVFAAE